MALMAVVQRKCVAQVETTVQRSLSLQNGPPKAVGDVNLMTLLAVEGDCEKTSVTLRMFPPFMLYLG